MKDLYQESFRAVATQNDSSKEFLGSCLIMHYQGVGLAAGPNSSELMEDIDGY